MAEKTDEEYARWGKVLSDAGVRLMMIDGQMVVGIWSDLDSPRLRQALAFYENNHEPWRYLDGPGIPDKYKTRNVPGGENPLPISVLMRMQQSTEPWVVRDEFIRIKHWLQKPVPYPFKSPAPAAPENTDDDQAGADDKE